MAFCNSCGNQLDGQSTFCSQCGASTNKNNQAKIESNQLGSFSDKEWLPALLLCLFLGTLGIHRFYTGHTKIGIVQLLTLGGCGIWTLIDFIMIVTGSFKDSNGLPLKK